VLPQSGSGKRRVLVLVCRGPECGGKRDSASVHSALCSALPGRVPPGTEVLLRWQSCFGQCQKGVNVMVRQLGEREDVLFLTTIAGATPAGGALYHRVVPSEVPRIVDEHVVGGKVIVEFKKRG
jgi:(2Fe-2S) ferredoxin